MAGPGRGLGLCWSMLLALTGCVQHPTKGVDNTVPNTPTSLPWNAPVTVSGAYAVTSVPIEISAENPSDPDAGASAAPTFSVLETVNATGDQIVSPGLPAYYVWQTRITIPQRFWQPGISAGFEARLRARALVANGPPLTLGTPEHPGSPALCAAFRENPNAFGSADVQAQAKIACSSTASDDELEFVFDTTDYNNHCSLPTEACCTGAQCTGSTCDKTLNRCVTPSAPATPSTPPGGQGGVPDASKCQKGEVQLVAGFTPEQCQAGFTISAARHCNPSTGKFDVQPTAKECNQTDVANDPGAECYCDIAGDVCGQPAGSPCTVQTTTGDVPGVCAPPSLCVINTGNGATGYICSDNLGTATTPQCWKVSDVKQTNSGSAPNGDTGGSGGSSGGGSSGSAGSAAAGKGGA